MQFESVSGHAYANEKVISFCLIHYFFEIKQNETTFFIMHDARR